MQYYYIVYKRYSNLSGKETTHGHVSNMHPFEWLKQVEFQGNDRTTLLNFIKITEEEASVYPEKYDACE